MHNNCTPHSVPRMFIPCSTKKFRRFFLNKISLPERRNKRKSVLEITKMYYFKIKMIKLLNEK